MTKKVFFTPGPSQLYPTVPRHIEDALAAGIPSISHRSEEFKQIFKVASEGVKQVMGAPASTHVFFVGSGTEAMERIVQNCAESKSVHFVNGSFSKRMHKIAGQLGKRPEKIEAMPGKWFDFSSVIIPKDAELLCFTHNETSMGVKTPMEDIVNVRSLYPDALASVDVVSSAPCVDVNWSAMDCAFFSVQKCFGLPAGLGVILANERAMEKARSLQQKGMSIGSFHSFQSLAEDEAKLQTPETPNVLNMYLLGKVCEDFQKIGIERIKKDAIEKSAMLYDYFDAHPTHKPFVEVKNVRSDTVIVAKTPQGSKPIIAKLKERGLVIGSGYAEYKDACIRIANFPAHSVKDVERLIAEMPKEF